MIKHRIKSVPALLLALLIFCYCHETQENYYPTLEDARNEGAIDRGWIPTILPLTSINITEKHNIDTNTVWIKFTANASDLKDLLRQLRILTKKEIDELFPFNHPGKWWEPKENAKNSFTISAYEYKIRFADGRTEDKIGFFFIDVKNSVAYYYNPM